MAETTHSLARQLADRAEAVCLHYLSNGRRQGSYWMVGDVRNAPGRSLFVRLLDGPKGPAGKWTDAATGEHGDLLDILRGSCGLGAFAHVLAEARRFLALPEPPSNSASSQPSLSRSTIQSPNSSHVALRLFAMSQSIQGTLAETYLRSRGITAKLPCCTLRFHPCCYYRPGTGPVEEWPAMLAAVTDNHGRITGIHRTWLARGGSGKAPVATPRRAMGDLLGNGVRFGDAADVLAVGEGIESVLSLRSVLPDLPMVAALSAAHVAAFIPPQGVRRLYIARDRDHAGDTASSRLAERMASTQVRTILLSPTLHDFNDDLRQLGKDILLATLHDQRHPSDARSSLLAMESA